MVVLKPKPRYVLSISNHHPEHWQSSWSVRTALVALTAFMPTNPNGALGSLAYTKEERRALAIKSREIAPRYGTPERQKLIDEIHEYMLSKAPPEVQESPENPAAGAADVNLPNFSVAETVVVERRESASNTNSEQTSRQLPAVQPSEQQFRGTPQQRVIRQTDDRIFYWADIGLKIAIVVLILKKYIKSNGHGAVFLDES